MPTATSNNKPKQKDLNWLQDCEKNVPKKPTDKKDYHAALDWLDDGDDVGIVDDDNDDDDLPSSVGSLGGSSSSSSIAQKVLRIKKKSSAPAAPPKGGGILFNAKELLSKKLTTNTNTKQQQQQQQQGSLFPNLNFLRGDPSKNSNINKLHNKKPDDVDSENNIMGRPRNSNKKVSSSSGSDEEALPLPELIEFHHAARHSDHHSLDGSFASLGDESYLRDLERQKETRDENRLEEVLEDALELYQVAVKRKQIKGDSEALFHVIFQQLLEERMPKHSEEDRLLEERLEHAMESVRRRAIDKEVEDIWRRTKEGRF